MAVSTLGRDTTSVDELVWNGSGFEDTTADTIWRALSAPLQHIARIEIAAGNVPVNILRNDATGAMLLAFACPPMASRDTEPSIRIHTRFAHGNYCYDGTSCTFEHAELGHFLAFNDPDDADDDHAPPERGVSS